MSESEGASYARSGVSLEKADTFLAALLRWVKKTEEIPGSAVRHVIPNGYYASVLDLGLEEAIAFSTDGVGSKILVAERMKDYSSIGIDCIAMNVNDVICVGAKPLAMVDYLAIQNPSNDVGEQIGKSLYEGCKRAGISIPGGELAQIPDMIRGEREGDGLDLAGAVIGLVKKHEVSCGQGIAPGDKLLAIASSGLHSNGYSLARKVLLDMGKLSLTQRVAELGCTLGEELLKPTEIYVPQFLALKAAGLMPKALLHITGGGLQNLLRVRSSNVRFVIDAPPEKLPIFQLIEKLGSVSVQEMHRVFNMGLGLVLVVDSAKEAATWRVLEDQRRASGGPSVHKIGHVAAGTGKCVEVPGRGLRFEGHTYKG